MRGPESRVLLPKAPTLKWIAFSSCGLLVFLSRGLTPNLTVGNPVRVAMESSPDRLVRSGLSSWIDDELAFHSTVTQAAADATLEGVGAWR
jgi:hypothetical protein